MDGATLARHDCGRRRDRMTDHHWSRGDPPEAAGQRAGCACAGPGEASDLGPLLPRDSSPHSAG